VHALCDYPGRQLGHPTSFVFNTENNSSLDSFLFIYLFVLFKVWFNLSPLNVRTLFREVF